MNKRGKDEFCWSKMGVIGGDRTCPELQTVIHCRNCEVYSDAAFTRMQTKAPEGYLEEWARRIAAPIQAADASPRRAFIFRLRGEHLALDAQFVREASDLKPIHRIPHVKSDLLRGLVNVRGELMLCIALEKLLGSEGQAVEATGIKHFRRLLVFGEKQRAYAFEADEVLGLATYNPKLMQPLPVTMAKSENRFCQGIISHDRISAGMLDLQLLFSELGRRHL